MSERDEGAAQSRPRTIYGRRHGRPLRQQRQALMDSLAPRLTVALPPPGGTLDPFALFPRRPREVWLEVGFGGGEHLAFHAERNRDVGIIGCEPFVNGVSSLLRHVADSALENVRLHQDDARWLVEALPPACLGRAFVLFPDPWPKARHHRRRFLQTDTVAMLADRMADGAELRLGSDVPEMVEWMEALMAGEPAFALEAAWMGDDPDRPADWPRTRYETKALASPRAKLMSWRRRARQGG